MIGSLDLNRVTERKCRVLLEAIPVRVLGSLRASLARCVHQDQSLSRSDESESSSLPGRLESGLGSA